MSRWLDFAYEGIKTLASPPDPAATDECRRARLFVILVLISSLAGALGFLQYMSAGLEQRAWFTLSVGVLLLGTIPILARTQRLAWPGNLFIALVLSAISLSPRFSPEAPQVPLAICVVGFVAAFLLGPRAGVAWTAVGLAVGITTAISNAGKPTEQLAWQASILTGLIGMASVSVELSRRRALREGSDANQRMDVLGGAAFHWIVEVRDGLFVYASPSVETSLGWAPEAVVGLPFSNTLHPDEVDAILPALDPHAPGSFRIEHRTQRPGGGWSWTESYGVRHPDPDGPDHWIVASRDIDAERRARDRIADAEKLEGIAVLSAGVAHDFNNLLTVIAGNAENVADAETRNEILDATQRAAALTQQLLAFGRKQPVEMEVLDAGSVVAGLRPIIESLAGEEVQVELRTTEAPCPVLASRPSIENALLNLIHNARAAIQGSGTIRIDVERSSDAAGDDRILIQVGDDGGGMSEETQRRAFDPFFTTKGNGSGSGLGLASVHGSMKQLGGEVELRSELGKGTVVTLRLPVASGALSPHDAPSRGTTAGPTHGRVLLAEDNRSIRDLVARALGGVGFEVVASVDGKEALVHLESDARFDLLITDVMMPGARGSDIAEAFRSLHPGLPILFISGYAEDQLGSWRSRSDGIDFLAKPFTASRIVERASALLDGEGRGALPL